MITGSFRTSKIMNKSGHKYEIHWTEKGGLLYENVDVREYEIKGITNTGRKFTGTGIYLKGKIGHVVDIVPNRSIGKFEPCEEIHKKRRKRRAKKK